MTITFIIDGDCGGDGMNEVKRRRKKKVIDVKLSM